MPFWDKKAGKVLGAALTRIVVGVQPSEDCTGVDVQDGAPTGSSTGWWWVALVAGAPAGGLSSMVGVF